MAVAGRKTLQRQNRPAHLCVLDFQAPNQVPGFKLQTCRVVVRARFLRGQFGGGAILKPIKQCRQVDAQRAGDSGQIVEADVLLATLDLANVGPVEPADVSKFLLRPILGRPQIVDSLAQQFE